MPLLFCRQIATFYLRMNTEFASIMPGLGSSALVKRDGLSLSLGSLPRRTRHRPRCPDGFSDRQDLIMPNLPLPEPVLPKIARAQRAAPGATPAADRRAPWLARVCGCGCAVMRVWLSV